jgi:hypothetical protein
MNGSIIRELSRSLKEQISRSSEAWKEQPDPIFRFWAEGEWWGFPFFSLSAGISATKKHFVSIGLLRPSSLQILRC